MYLLIGCIASCDWLWLAALSVFPKILLADESN
jgi:hypothetical protein